MDEQTQLAMQQDPLRQYAEELKTLIQDKVLTRSDFARQMQLVLALRNELFWRAKQFLKFKFVNNGMTVVPITGPPGSTSATDARTNLESQALSYVFNITRSDGQKFVAIVGARAPYVNFEPKDSHDPESLRASRDAKAVGRYLAEMWNTQQHQKDLARTIFRSGPQFGHVCWVTDGEKHGFETVTDTAVVDHTSSATLDCQECGLSVDHPADDAPATPCVGCSSPLTTVSPSITYQKLQAVNPRQVPKGMPELHPYTIFEVTTPMGRREIEKCEWLRCETLEISGKIRRLYGALVEDIKDEVPTGETIPSQQTAADAFDIISNDDTLATQRTDRWWWARTWLTPDMYSYASQGLQKVLTEQYQDGVRLVYVNGNYVEGVAEKLADVWIVCKTGTDDRILGDPICHDLIPINEIINNFFNLAIETVLRGIPKTILDPRVVDREAMRSNSASPNEVIWAKAGLGGDLSKMMAQLPVARFGDQMLELAQLFRTYSREVDGVLEAAFGGGDPSPTWRQDQQRKNQALAQFYVAYDEMRHYWEAAHRCAFKLLKKFGIGKLTIPSDDQFVFGSHTVDFETLTPELVRVEAEETMPETRADEVDKLQDQFALPPQVQEMIGLFSPVNSIRVHDLMSIRGMTSPYAHLVEKTLKLISQLVEGQPVADIDPATGQPAVGPDGQPAPMKPSIMPDPFAFKNASFVAEIVRAWYNAPAAEEYAASKPQGYQNVQLFGLALDKMAAPPPAPGPVPTLSYNAPLDKLPPEQLAAVEKVFGINPPPPTGLPPISAQFPNTPPKVPPGQTKKEPVAA